MTVILSVDIYMQFETLQSLLIPITIGLIATAVLIGIVIIRNPELMTVRSDAGRVRQTTVDHRIDTSPFI